jgi:hypothetical protein
VNALTKTEVKELAVAEEIIGRGLKAFWEVGSALLAVRDGRLYREKYKSFDDYCRARWSMGKSRAYQLIAASEVVSGLSTTVDAPAPSTERQTRPLSGLPAETRREVWAEASANGQPTAARVEELAAKALASMSAEKQLEVARTEEARILDRAAVRDKAEAGESRSARLERIADHINKARRLTISIGEAASGVMLALDDAAEHLERVR